MSLRSQPSTTIMDSPLSARDEGSAVNAFTAAPAEVTAVADIIEKLKGSLGSLGKTLELAEQTVRMIKAGGEAEIAHQIGGIRRHMEEQDKKQDEKISEIQALFKEVIERDIIEHLTVLIHKGIMEEIDALVAEQVALILPEYIPQELQDELRHHRQQLDEVQKALHNSESRRANATLRSHKLSQKVHTLFNTHGEVPQDFPRTLSDMFSISAETAALLVKEYGLGEASSSRERNINRLMQHCGIQYQL